MIRIESVNRTQVLAVCALAACALAWTGCDAGGDSRVVSTARELADLFGPAGAEPYEEVETQSPVGRPAGTKSPTPGAGSTREVVVIEGGETSIAPDAEPEETGPAAYQYVDAEGGLHMVRGLHAVPAAYRSSAKEMSGSRVINRYESKPLPVRRRTVVVSGSGFNPNRMNVVLFSAEWCGACKKTKRLLDQEGVLYEVRDIDLDPAAKDEVRGILGSVRIPLLDIDGTYVSGYQPKEIRRLVSRS